MTSILVVAHEELAREFSEVVRTILNVDPSPVFYVGAKFGESKEEIAAHITHFFSEHPEEVLIFVDLFGSTHANMCLPHLKEHHVEMIAGFNLPMLVKTVVCRESHSLPELVKKIVDYGQHHIYSAQDMALGESGSHGHC